jgi:hypothetical protein
MSDSDDLFAAYRSERAAVAGRNLKGDALAAALQGAVRNTFSVMETLVADVAQALGEARYSIRLERAVTDRSSFIRLDRSSDQFRDYLRNWSLQRAESRSGGMHWEAQITVSDHRRATAEIGLAVVIEWVKGGSDEDVAFVEFWTTGKGVMLPSESRGFQHALVASIVQLEEDGVLKSAKPRPR